MKLAPKLTHPCPQDWNAMTGDAKKRFCSQCQLHVHNLSAMTEGEQIDLLKNRSSRVCIAYLQDDQTLQIQSRTWLSLKRLSRWTRAAAAILSVSLPALLASCSSTPPPPPAASECPPPPQIENHSGGKIVAGGLLPDDPPLWRRVLQFWKY